MRPRLLTNLFLFIFAVVALVALFKYTDAGNIGIVLSFREDIQSLKRIIQEKPPETELSATEKENLRSSLVGEKKGAPFFCQSVYFPFIPGASWSYQIISGNDSDVVKIGIPALSENQNRDANSIVFLDGRIMSHEKWTVRTIASCQGGKVNFTDLNFLLVFLRDRIVTTPCVSGQYNFSFPKDSDILKGYAWLEKGCLIHDRLDENYKQKESEVEENLEVKGKVLGQEDVTVPAGTFSAQKIELDIKGDQNITGGIKTIESVINFWITEGVGIVKITYEEKNGNKPPVVQQLSGFQIPTERNNKISN